MRGPRSATGEDTVELHLPGNPILAKMVVDALLAGGASAAEAGAFTARAFFNGKLDLAAAEGVAAVISAQNEQQLIAARQLTDGELSRRLRPITEQLASTLALVETGLDFSEEDITVLDRRQLLLRLHSVQRLLNDLAAQSGRFGLLPQEPSIVLYGRPNAGKSSLLNALTRDHRAVVSSQAGTTRDALSATIRLPRGFARLIDVAGVDDDDQSDAIATAAQQIARQTASEADVVVLIRDITDPRPDPALPMAAHLIVHTKADLPATGAALNRTDATRVSVVTGMGIDHLRGRIDELVFRSPRDQALLLNSRHEQSITSAIAALNRIQYAAHQSAEIDAMELREAPPTRSVRSSASLRQTRCWEKSSAASVSENKPRCCASGAARAMWLE